MVCPSYHHRMRGKKIDVDVDVDFDVDFDADIDINFDLDDAWDRINHGKLSRMKLFCHDREVEVS